MSAASVPSGMGFGVILMPANPDSPFTTVKVERYVPGGGSNFVGAVGEEHTLPSAVQSISETARRVLRSADTSVAHTVERFTWVSMGR
jgi:hypothetical protein